MRSQDSCFRRNDNSMNIRPRLFNIGGTPVSTAWYDEYLRNNGVLRNTGRLMQTKSAIDQMKI